MFLNGLPQKKGVSPSVNLGNGLIKPVKDVFSVNLSPSAPPVTNVLSVVEGLPVGTRLENFWQVLGPEGFESKSSIHPEGRVQPSFQSQTPSHQNPSDMERICQSPQEQLLAGGIAFSPSKTSGRKSKGSILSRVLQQTLHCPQTKSKVAANLRSQCPQPVSQGQNLQNGNSGINSPILTTRGVGNVA